MMLNQIHEADALESIDQLNFLDELYCLLLLMQKLNHLYK
jgi:hypothetical protein